MASTHEVIDLTSDDDAATVNVSAHEVIDLIDDDLTWNDSETYYASYNGETVPLYRRLCEHPSCNVMTQLEMCTEHLRVILGLQVKKSNIKNAGWGLFTTITRGKQDFLNYFTGEECWNRVGEYIVHQGNNAPNLDCTIQRCSVACANNKQFANCTLKVYSSRCKLVTRKVVYAGQELYTTYGTSYRK